MFCLIVSQNWIRFMLNLSFIFSLKEKAVPLISSILNRFQEDEDWNLQSGPKIQLRYSFSSMGIPISRLNISLLFFHLFILQFSSRISAIRYFQSFKLFISSLWLLRKTEEMFNLCGDAVVKFESLRASPMGIWIFSFPFIKYLPKLKETKKT